MAFSPDLLRAERRFSLSLGAGSLGGDAGLDFGKAAGAGSSPPRPPTKSSTPSLDGVVSLKSRIGHLPCLEPEVVTSLCYAGTPPRDSLLLGAASAVWRASGGMGRAPAAPWRVSGRPGLSSWAGLLLLCGPIACACATRTWRGRGASTKAFAALINGLARKKRRAIKARPQRSIMLDLASFRLTCSHQGSIQQHSQLVDGPLPGSFELVLDAARIAPARVQRHPGQPSPAWDCGTNICN